MNRNATALALLLFVALVSREAFLVDKPSASALAAAEAGGGVQEARASIFELQPSGYDFVALMLTPDAATTSGRTEGATAPTRRVASDSQTTDESDGAPGDQGATARSAVTAVNVASNPVIVQGAAPVGDGEVAGAAEVADATNQLHPPAWAAAPIKRTLVPPPRPRARAAVVMDEASGAVLFKWNSYQPLPPASLTKIVTAVVALEQGDLDTVVEVDVDYWKMNGSSLMRLRPGDRFSLRDLLFGLMLPSGNDAALAIGRAISGSDAAFVAEMNALMDRLGLPESRFANPHGLDAPGHLMSAYDLALVSRYAMSVEGFYPLAASKSWTANGSKQLELNNLNAMLWRYPGADGVKVGYTGKAGKTLVASAVKNGHRVYVVLMNGADNPGDATKLLDWTFENHKWPD